MLWLVCAFALIIQSSCTKSVPKPEQTTPTKTGTSTTPVAADSFTRYVILPGKQFAEGTEFVYKPLSVTEMHFLVQFDSSAIYKTDTAHNQADINKLNGFGDNNAFDHHKFSARFGWNWKNNALWLYAYIYNNGVMSNKTLGSIPIGKPADCAIIVAGNQYRFVLNGVTTVMPRTSTTATGVGYKLFPYFGGTETAPHKITIAIKEIK